MAQLSGFEKLIREAEARPFLGWDFSWIADRWTTDPLPWDYNALVLKRARESTDLLDLDTGGGEWLSVLPYRPALTIGTESIPPNVSVAARRLHPLGVGVVRIEGAPDNNDQRTSETRGRLPFRRDSLHLVVNRHSSYVASEISRILLPGGYFITQQVGDRSEDFCRLLEIPPPPSSSLTYDLSLAKAQLKAAGLRITESGENEGTMTFNDVGAFAWYLKAIPWTVRDFSIPTYRTCLEKLHSQIQESGPLRVQQSRFWLEAAKPTLPD